MAAKKTEAKPKAQPKAKAEPKAEEIEEVFEPAADDVLEYDESIEIPFSASQLADMGRQFKAGRLSRQIVLDVHSAYLSAVSKGAEASEADVKFVKGHLEVIKAW